MAYLPEYHLYESVLLVSDATNDSFTYAKAVRGDYPWHPTIDEVQSISRGYLWQMTCARGLKWWDSTCDTAGHY